MVAANGMRVARLRAVHRKPVEPGIVVVESAGLGADPEAAVGIGGQRPDVVLGQRPGIVTIGLVDVEFVTVETIETILGTDPDEPCAILGNGPGGCLRESLAGRKGAEMHRIDTRYVAGQRGLRADRRGEPEAGGSEPRPACHAWNRSPGATRAH